MPKGHWAYISASSLICGQGKGLCFKAMESVCWARICQWIWWDPFPIRVHLLTSLQTIAQRLIDCNIVDAKDASFIPRSRLFISYSLYSSSTTSLSSSRQLHITSLALWWMKHLQHWMLPSHSIRQSQCRTDCHRFLLSLHSKASSEPWTLWIVEMEVVTGDQLSLFPSNPFHLRWSDLDHAELGRCLNKENYCFFFSFFLFPRKYSLQCRSIPECVHFHISPLK